MTTFTSRCNTFARQTTLFESGPLAHHPQLQKEEYETMAGVMALGGSLACPSAARRTSISWRRNGALSGSKVSTAVLPNTRPRANFIVRWGGPTFVAYHQIIRRFVHFCCWPEEVPRVGGMQTTTTITLSSSLMAATSHRRLSARGRKEGCPQEGRRRRKAGGWRWRRRRRRRRR